MYWNIITRYKTKIWPDHVLARCKASLDKTPYYVCIIIIHFSLSLEHAADVFCGTCNLFQSIPKIWSRLCIIQCVACLFSVFLNVRWTILGVSMNEMRETSPFWKFRGNCKCMFIISHFEKLNCWDSDVIKNKFRAHCVVALSHRTPRDPHCAVSML